MAVRFEPLVAYAKREMPRTPRSSQAQTQPPSTTLRYSLGNSINLRVQGRTINCRKNEIVKRLRGAKKLLPVRLELTTFR